MQYRLKPPEAEVLPPASASGAFSMRIVSTPASLAAMAAVAPAPPNPITTTSHS